MKKEAEKEEFVKSLFLDSGRKATAGAIAALVGALGSDMRELQAAVSQICLDAQAGKTIDEAIVDKFHQGRIETTGFDVADATLDGNLPGALVALRSALETGTDPVMITSAIASNLRSLAKVSGVNRGTKSFEVAGELGMAPWQIDKARRQLTGWSPRSIAKAVQAIALADAQVKGASSDPIFALEKALATITQVRAAG
jgi:DNA polymerase-3 subunit delta